MDHKVVVMDQMLADQMRATLGLGLRKDDCKPVIVQTRHYNPPDPDIKWWEIKHDEEVKIMSTLEPYANPK
jgi:hypothetical protein